jgi:nanoRNase/pAp phosphatase (c-di-AMP/oligoRNAs hydrolase)
MNSNKDSVKTLIENANRIALFPSRMAGVDALSAAVGLYHCLTELGKDTKVIYLGEPPEISYELPKKDFLTNTKERSLIINVDYSNTNATNVHWDTEAEGSVKFVISPVPKDYDKNRVTTKVVGLDFDLAFLFGVRKLTELGATYKNLENELDTVKRINIGNSNSSDRFGYHNFIDSKVNSLSLLVLRHMPSWNLEPNKEAAEALLEGIKGANN